MLLILFYTLTINFILTLLLINNINCIFTTTCKYNKKTIILKNKIIYNVEN